MAVTFSYEVIGSVVPEEGLTIKDQSINHQSICILTFNGAGTDCVLIFQSSEKKPEKDELIAKLTAGKRYEPIKGIFFTGKQQDFTLCYPNGQLEKKNFVEITWKSSDDTRHSAYIENNTALFTVRDDELAKIYMTHAAHAAHAAKEVVGKSIAAAIANTRSKTISKKGLRF